MRVANNSGMVIPCFYETSWQHAWDCICIELGIEEA